MAKVDSTLPVSMSQLIESLNGSPAADAAESLRRAYFFAAQAHGETRRESR
jgi:(p)ppGpp synthase/HD superfamily hydrolase